MRLGTGAELNVPTQEQADYADVRLKVGTTGVEQVSEDHFIFAVPAFGLQGRHPNLVFSPERAPQDNVSP